MKKLSWFEMSKREAAAALLLLTQHERKERSEWVRKWIGRRDEEGAHAKLLQELISEDTFSYKSAIG